MQQTGLRYLRFTGLMGFLGGWLVIFAAISQNSWFVFTENAFSDLGNPAANVPWVFNDGMMVNGLLVLLYGVYLVYISFNKESTVGGASMMITGVFLMLIGVFNEGSKHHTFVSYWFFTQGNLTVLAWGLALYRESTLKQRGISFILMGIFGPVIAVLVPWPSIAAVEAYGILIMDVWVVLMHKFIPDFPENR